MSDFEKLCKSLENKIKQSYEQGVTIEEAEKLASEFLYAQMAISNELKIVDLDSRMKKSGIKAVRAAIYLAEAIKNEKKPSDVMLQALVDKNELVISEQTNLDMAEVEKAELERYYNIFGNAHIHYRSVSRGKFE